MQKVQRLSVIAVLAFVLCATGCPVLPTQYTLYVDQNLEEAGSVSISPDKKTFTAGEMVTLTATANPGYHFDSWASPFSDSPSVLSFAVNHDTTVTALFSANPKYTVEVTADDSAKGTVTKSPDKPSYEAGEKVTITATAASGFQFDHWSGTMGNTATNPFELEVAQNTTLTANFVVISTPHHVTFEVSPTGAGTINSTSGDYAEGSTISGVLATPSHGKVFSKWQINGVDSDSVNPRSFVVGVTDTTITAVFADAPTLTPGIIVAPAGAGSVSIDPAAGPYYAGDVVTLTATPNAGYVFGSWSGDITGTTVSKSWTLDSSPSVTATFVPTYTLTMNASAGAPILSAYPSGGVYTSGTSVTVTAPALSGYVFDGWKDGSTWLTSQNQNSYTYTVAADRTLVAQYTAITTTILVYLNADNNLEANGIQDVNEMEAADLRGSGINIIVLFDRITGYDVSNSNWTDTRLYQICYSGSTTPDTTITSRRVASSSLGITATGTTELNLGNQSTLSTFITWGKSAYPAAQNVLILWDHGDGWRKASIARSATFGIGQASASTAVTGLSKPWAVGSSGVKGVSYDDTSASFLATKNLGNAIPDGSFDVIGFDLCYAGMIEVAYELRNKASYMIASEEVTPGDGWEYHQWLSDFAAKGSKTPLELVNSVVDAYQTAYAAQVGTTLAGYDLSKVTGVMTALNAFSTQLSSSIVDAASQATIGGTIFNTVEDYYAVPGDLNLDLYDLAYQVKTQAATAAYASSQADDLMLAVSNLVVKEWHNSTTGTSGNPRSHGVALHFVSLDSSANPAGHQYAYFANHAVLSPTTTLVPSFVDAAGNKWVPNMTSSTVGSGLLYLIWYRAF